MLLYGEIIMNKTTLAILASTILISTSTIAATTITQPGNMVYAPQQTQQQLGSNYSANQQQAQQTDNNYGVTGNMRVEQEKEKTSEPKTAAEQGYVSTDEQAEIRERIESYGYENTARQKGITIQVPTENVGVSKNKKDKMWLFNWKGRLLDRGISAEKIDFEAGRLDKQDFERWASRQIRYADGK